MESKPSHSHETRYRLRMAVLQPTSRRWGRIAFPDFITISALPSFLTNDRSRRREEADGPCFTFSASSPRRLQTVTS